MTLKILMLVISNAFLLEMGQAFWKLGIMQNGNNYSLAILTNRYVLIGFAMYAVATAVWMYVLSKVDFIIAYPLTSLGYIFALFTAKMMFNETITIGKCSGVAVILFGIYLVTKH